MGCSPKLYSGNRVGHSVYQSQKIEISYGKKVKGSHRLIAVGTVRVRGPLYVSWTRPMKVGEIPLLSLPYPSPIQ